MARIVAWIARFRERSVVPGSMAEQKPLESGGSLPGARDEKTGENEGCHPKSTGCAKIGASSETAPQTARGPMR